MFQIITFETPRVRHVYTRWRQSVHNPCQEENYRPGRCEACLTACSRQSVHQSAAQRCKLKFFEGHYVHTKINIHLAYRFCLSWPADEILLHCHWSSHTVVYVCLPIVTVSLRPITSCVLLHSRRRWPNLRSKAGRRLKRKLKAALDLLRKQNDKHCRPVVMHRKYQHRPSQYPSPCSNSAPRLKPFPPNRSKRLKWKLTTIHKQLNESVKKTTLKLLDRHFINKTFLFCGVYGN